MARTYRVNPMSVTEFMSYLREHGISVTKEKTEALIRGGVFGKAAIAIYDAESEKTVYFIVRKKMDKWMKKNADEVREDEEIVFEDEEGEADAS